MRILCFLLFSSLLHAECDLQTAVAGGRRLSMPIFRLRADFAGANAVASSINFPSVLRNLPLQTVEARYRFELNNLSTTDSQTVSLCARAGLEMRMHSRNIEGLANGAVRFSSPVALINGLVLTPTNIREVVSEGAGGASTTSIIVSFSCDLSGMRQCSIGVSVPGGVQSAIPGTTVGIRGDVAFQNAAVLDTQLVFFLPIDIVISEDRGAVAGSLTTIINRSGGYSSDAQGALDYLPINNGRPF